MNLISKKDLLAITGISYGQLYRWKRQRLIPEEWFIKKSSYTGQETFFPREPMLSRIQTILELKDKYSMEQIAQMFAGGEKQGAGLSPDDLAVITQLPMAWRSSLPQLMNRSVISFEDVIAAVFIAQLPNLTDQQKEELLAAVPNPIPPGADGAIGVFALRGQYHLFILKGTASLSFDAGITPTLQAWSSIADPLRRQFQSIFQGGINHGN